MSKRLDAAVEVVKTHLETDQYSYSITRCHLRCYQLLKTHLDGKGKTYSKHVAMEWIESIAPELCKTTASTYRRALEKLDTAYHHKKVDSTKAQYEARQYYLNLVPWYKTHLDDFIVNMSGEYDRPYLQTIRNAVARFLSYLNNRGVTKPEDISHEMVAAFYRDDEHDSYKSKDVYNNCVRKFLRYLSARGIIAASISLALDKFVLPRLVYIDELTGSAQESFNNSGNPTLSAEAFREKAIEMNGIVEQHRYSKTMRKAFRKVWKELYVFFEANSLHYSVETALAWATHMRNYTVQWKTFRRAVMLFEQYRANGQIDPQIVYSYGSDPVGELPEWCKGDYQSFYRLKEKDGYARSTLNMYRSACLRLLDYLNRIGLSAWSEVTPETLKDFHLQDPHSTAEGKNAYSYKIRIFLEYLGEIGRLPSALFMAVPKEATARMRIIDTLSDDDVDDLYRFAKNVDDTMNLRHTAMILIGLRMGIRASDIAKLKFSDISWDQKAISIFIKLPMPIEVGNALYRYIVYGRPNVSSEHIFISHRVPYNRLNRGVCQKALQKALPVKTGGFHITRKTFASRMLVNGVQTGRIAETLGHATTQSVMTYLSTDDDNMRLCAISLDGIPARGGWFA